MNKRPPAATFDADGRRGLKTRLGWALRRAYNAPVDARTRPLDTEGMLPIFVVGCGHSGTSLLAAILGRSDDLLMIGYESGAFFPKQSLATSREVVRSWLNLARQADFRGFVEKTPKHILCTDRIRRVVPDARFVGIVRDGRDVMASFLSRGLQPGFAVDRWVADNAALLAERDASDFRLIRFEDLIEDPAAVTQSVCADLGITYSEDMLRGSSDGYGWIKDGNMGLRAEQTSRDVYDSRGKWKGALTDAHLHLFWAAAGPTMGAFGYSDRSES